MDIIVLFIVFLLWAVGGIFAIFFDIKYVQKEYGVRFLQTLIEDVEQNPLPALVGYGLRYTLYIIGGWVTLLIRILTVTKTRS